MNDLSHFPQPMDDVLRAMQLGHGQAGAVSAATRIDRLTRLMQLLDKHADAFCEALDQDFGGRPPCVSLMNDILSTQGSLKYARSNVRRWMKKDRRSGVLPFNLFGARVEVEHTPKGVVGILGAWNVPLFTTFAPLASVLAAGNCAMLKPSEFVPRTSALLESAIAEFFSPNEIQVITGSVEVSRAFSSLPFDHLVLTGSSGTGRAVMRAAAEHLVPVTLELGGKSPAIIGRTADLALSAQRIITGKTMNGGQVCVTPDTVYVPEPQLEAFVSACCAAYVRLYPANSTETVLTAIINDAHEQRLDGYLQEIKDSGGRVVSCSPDASNSGRRRALQLVISPPADSRIAQDEIFGPILQIETYTDLDKVIERISHGPIPLALYYFGRDKNEERRVLDRTRSGGVSINDVLMHVAAHDAPFGGMGHSGMGAYHGREGFLEFSHPRTQYRAGWWDPRQALGLVPPYSDKLYARLRKMIRA